MVCPFGRTAETDSFAQNEALLNDKLYLGLHQRRVSGEEYDRFVDRFVQSARELYPKAVIHFVSTYVHLLVSCCDSSRELR